MNKEIKIIYSIFCCVIFFSCLFVAIKNDSLAREKTKKEEAVLVEKGSDYEGISNKKATEIIVNSEDNGIVSVPGDTYVGKWKRIGMTINNEEAPFSEAILSLESDKFIKNTNCQISGSLIVSEDKIIMRVEEDGCDEGKKDFSNYYSLSTDKQTLTLLIKDSAFEMRDIYQRVK